jgi:Tol biopolymer transport system component/predicted Ser/Thr protein kinase
MGEVYRAKDTKLGREVAIKVLPQVLAQDPDRLARFEREAKVLASLNHPNIAQIYGLEERALVMELVPGNDLGSLVKGALPLEMALNYARQIAEALEAAHEKGIIHRDLKPANIMITPAGVVKVLDFGLAAISESTVLASNPVNSPTITMRATEAGMIMGTAAYMSPEQAAGKPVDKRADIWSFGVVLWEMLTGRRLFDGETISHTLADVLRERIDFEKLPPEIPVEIRCLLRRLLDRDVKTRLRDIGEARVAIGTYLAAPEVKLEPVRQTQTRPAWGIALAMSVLAAIAGFGWWRAAHSTVGSSEPALMHFNLDLGPDAITGPLISTIISPDGTRLAYILRGANGTPQIATRALNQPQATLLAGTEGATGPFFSPDSRWIGFFAGGTLKKIPMQGGGAVTLCEAGGTGGVTRGASWGDDGQIVFGSSSGTAVGLSRVADTGGTPQSLTKPAPGEISHRWPQVLPGAKAVLFTSSAVLGDYDDGIIEVLSLQTGKWKVVQRGGYFGRYLPTGHLVFIHQGTLMGVPFDPERLEVNGTAAPLVENVDASALFGNGQFDASRNGTLVYTNGRASNEGWPTVWLDGSGKTLPLLPAAPSYGLLLSPDGKRLATRLRGDVHVYDIERDRMTRLTFTRTCIRVLWAPNGKHIVFSSTLPSGSMLQWIRADGGGEAQTLMEAKEQVAPASFTPDGKLLAFSALSGGQHRVLTLPLDLSDPEHPKPGKAELLLETSANPCAFSPDGKWIAYASAESGRIKVYVRSFPGPGGKWEVSSDGGQFPIWSRASHELFFESLDSHIMTTHYSTVGDSFEAEKPRRWSNFQLLALGLQPTFDLAPDGKRFAVFAGPNSLPGQNAAVHVSVILNFFDLLRRGVVAVGK